MIALLNNIRPVSALWVLFFGLLLRTPIYFLGVPVEGIPGSPFFPGFFEQIVTLGWTSYIICFLLVFFQSMIFNKICIDHDVLYAHTYLPGYFYMLFCSLFKEAFHLSPQILANTFALLALYQLFQLYKHPNPAKIIFYSGFYLGCAFLFSLHFLLIPFFLLVAIILFKTVSLKDLLAIFFGVFTPIYLYFGLKYVFFGDVDFNFIKVDRLPYKPGWNDIYLYLPLVVLLVITLISLAKLSANYLKNNIKTRRITLLLVSYFVYWIIAILINAEFIKLNLMFLMFPTAVFVSYFHLGHKARKWKELLHWVIFASVVFSLYKQYLPFIP